MPNVSYAFTIFFLTLGPIKTIPVFYNLTGGTTPRFRQKTALQATLISTAVCLFIAFIGRNVVGKWNVSLEALELTGGLILLLSALKIVTMQPQPAGGQKAKATADTPLSATIKLALSPLTTPVIITPYGVVAILFYMVISEGNSAVQLQILGLIALVMLLNYLGMLFANKIMNVLGIAILQLIGWVFAVMQSALAIDIMLRAFKSLGVIQPS